MAGIPINGAPPNNNKGAEQGGPVEKDPKKRSLFKRTWDGLGLNLGMLLMMAKGASPPVIATAIFQATPVARTYSTLGYLVSIMSILSFAIMPRAKFLQTMLLNIIGICIGSAVALLQIWCAVKARQHTTQISPSSSGGPSPGAQVSSYNSSASAVSAVWLFFNIYISNTLRASRPQLQFPVIMYSIFANVASTYAPQFATMDQGISFAKSLLEAFLTGFAIAAGVSLVIVPLTSRKVVFKEMAAYIGALRGCLKAQAGYMHSLENADMFSPPEGTGDTTEGEGKEGHHFNRHKAKEPGAEMSPEAKTLKAAIAGLGVLHGKLHGDLSFAKKEVAYGKLKADDLSEVFRLFRNIMLPMVGIGTTVDIFENIAEMRGWKTGNTELTIASNGEDGPTEDAEASKEQEKGQWNEIMKSLHSPFEAMTQVIDEGMQHVLYTLELAKAPQGARRSNKGTDRAASSTEEDVEAKGDAITPGQTGFLKYLEQKTDEFYKQREVTLKAWCKLKGINVPSNIASDSLQLTPSIHLLAEDLIQHRRNQQQLYVILYVEFLLWSIGRAVIDFARYADLKVEDGTMKKNRLIFPSLKRTKKWVRSTFKVEDTNTENTPDFTESGASQVYLGDSLRAKKDPEHLPAANVWERFGNGVRAISSFLGSSESAFGFRVACATMSIGIVAYLRDTQSFFITQRLVWSMIIA